MDGKRLVIEFMRSLPGDSPKWDFVSDDLKWWIQGIGTVTKSEMIEIAARVVETRKSGEMFLDHVTAEEDRVAVESHSRIEMTDGRFYENTYHFLFFIRDGKIAEVHEHFDTAYARDFFGADAQQNLIGSAS